MSVRVAIVAESFPPDVNGVAHCVLRVAEHLVMRGHQPLVIAPAPARGAAGAAGPFPCPVVRQPSVPMPGYAGFRIGVPGRALADALAGHGTEVVHLASPFVLGRAAMSAARRRRLPTVAVYQTDVPAYARVYGLGGPGEAAAWRRLHGIHNAACRTLAPSAASAASLRGHGVQRVWIWGRGVAFAGAVARLADDPRLRLAMGQAGRAQTLSRGWSVLGDQLIGHYRAVSGMSGETGRPDVVGTDGSAPPQAIGLVTGLPVTRRGCGGRHRR
jgi:hypothetical protein